MGDGRGQNGSLTVWPNKPEKKKKKKWWKIGKVGLLHNRLHFPNFYKERGKEPSLLEKRSLFKQLTESVVSPICQALTKETHQYEHRKERIELPDPGLKGLIIKALSRSC